MLTEESFKDFDLWKDYKEILKLSKLIIGVRSNFDNAEKKILNISNKNFVKTNIVNISSLETE